MKIGAPQPDASLKELKPWGFSLFAIVVGVSVGLLAVAYRGLIAFFHNLLFLGRFSFFYDANSHTPPSPWGPFIILIPVLGAAGVAFLIKNFAPEARGTGVPEVVDAVYYEKGLIRPAAALFKSLASSLSIGSGGSVGREGPIIQIGASFGSTVAQIIRMPVQQRITLIKAGAAAGVAATFNAPIGGILFAVEILMQDVSLSTMIPVTISAVTATYIGRLFFGPHPSLVIPALEANYFQVRYPLVLAAYAVLGVIAGFASLLFIKSIYAFEDFFEKRIRRSYYCRHMLGMFLVGLLIYLSISTLGSYYIEGVGYATIQDVLSATLTDHLLLLALFALKLTATSLTLGSGGSGGVFSPSLYIGAVLGGAYGCVVCRAFPVLRVNPAAFAVAGMGGVLGGTTGIAVASIVMIFEMTLDYSVIIPLTITVVLGYGVRRTLFPESVYTMKLIRRGHHVPEGLGTDFRQLRHAHETMEDRVLIIPASTPIDEALHDRVEQSSAAAVLSEESGSVTGVVSKGALLSSAKQAAGKGTLGEIARRRILPVEEETPLFRVIALLRASEAAAAIVTGRARSLEVRDVKGIISQHELGKSAAGGIDSIAAE